jgi:hypothetical protein
MRHYEREKFRHLNDSERQRDYDYVADDAWVGANEAVPHGLTTAYEGPVVAHRSVRSLEPPWSSHGGYTERAFATERAYDEDRQQGREHGRDLGLGYGRGYDVRAGDHERTASDPYDRRAQFRGVGPKGWTRPDDRILDEVCRILAEDPDLDATEIAVRVEDGGVFLSGTVGDVESKYLAEDLAEDVAGVRGVDNELRVVRIAERRWREGGSRQRLSGGGASTSTSAVRR